MAAAAVTDVHLSGLGIDRALPLAQRLVDELRILETTAAPEAGEWTYLSADLGARALMTFDSAFLQDTLHELYAIAGGNHAAVSDRRSAADRWRYQGG